MRPTKKHRTKAQDNIKRCNQPKPDTFPSPPGHPSPLGILWDVGWSVEFGRAGLVKRNTRPPETTTHPQPPPLLCRNKSPRH